MIHKLKASFCLKSHCRVSFAGSFKSYSTIPEDPSGDKLTSTDESNLLRESTKTVIKEEEDIGKIDFQSILKYLDQNKERDQSVHRSFRSCCDLLSQGETAKAFEQLKELADTKGLDVAQFLVGFLYKIWKFDFENAFKYFMLAADQNHAGALYQIGLHYRFVKKDNQNCVKYLTLASDYNHSKAQYMLGLLYELGESDIEKDLKKSHEYFLKSASSGCYYAQHALGIHYTHGTSVIQKNPSKGADFYLLAANQGYHAAQFSYGYALFHGRGVEPNKPLACKYYKLASDQGNLYGRLSLGHCYEKGEGIEKDLLKAYDLYRRTRSAKALNRMALLHYYDNPPIEHDLDKAIELFLEAEGEGSTLASQNLGNVYYFKRKNGEKALQYYLKAVEAGHAHACKQVARIYKKGFDGIEKNMDLAVKYYKMSLERKEDVSTLVELADLFNFETRDYDKAFEVYKRAAEKNSDHAYLILGDFYKYGKGVDAIDITKAFECYLASAKLGNVSGCIVVSKAYLSGIGLEQNFELAVQYLQSACDQNSTDAQLKLGFLYINGPISLRDVNKGIEMFKLSASQSNSKACYELSKIYGSGLHGITQDSELSKFYFEESQKYGTFTYMNQPNYQNKNGTTPSSTSSNSTQTLSETIYNNNTSSQKE